MTLAELLRRSAEYARRSVEELARALNPPARHGAPSFEPAYAPRGNRHFRPKHHGGGHGKRFFHWSSHCEARLRRPHVSIFGRLNRRGRGGKFFRSNHVGGNKGTHCHRPFLLALLFKAFKVTKLTLHCAVRPSACADRVKSAVMPNLMLRAGVSSLKWSPCNGDLWQFRFLSLYGQRITPSSSPYEVLKQSVCTGQNVSDADKALLRYEDQFRSKRAIGAEIREKLRGLAVYQQTMSNFFFPTVPSESKLQSAIAAFTISSADQILQENRQVVQPSEGNDEGCGYVESSVVSAAVDFTVAPRLALPVVGELNDDMLDSVRSAINTQITNLRAVLADIDRIAELGELPISVEQNGTVLRVHLPNCDADRANVLVGDKEVTHGRTVEIVAPRIHVPGTDPLISASSSEFELVSDSASEASDEVWQHVRDDTPGLTSMESSQSHSSPSLLTLG